MLDNGANGTADVLYSGEPLLIEASGLLLDDVDEGATVLLEVRWGLITLLRQQVDLCEQIENVDLKCPLEKGAITLSKEVELPQEIPPVCCQKAVCVWTVADNFRVNTLSWPMFTPMIRDR